ncbi:hypothetical protein R54767_02165 [Paraburkholderia gardini]|uniref:Uncharacterized protein n=1 Tax=Paraburkholderia gardini TaxID=2823469 RepID=A0ABN7QLD0_9BURK|nr:hypothetical protein R54767_02165 [Paraburkholderia gardini]
MKELAGLDSIATLPGFEDAGLHDDILRTQLHFLSLIEFQ